MISFDDSGERTQKPTERRRREARAQGMVPRSANLVTSLVLLVAGSAIWLWGSSAMMRLGTIMRTSLSTVAVGTTTPESLTTAISQTSFQCVLILLPIMSAAIAAAVIVNLVQTGFLWLPGKIAPQFERVDPVRQWNRVFRFETCLGFAASLIRMAVLMGVAFVYVQSRLGSAGSLIDGQPVAMLVATVRPVGELAIVLSLSLVVMSVIDYGFQYWRHERRLMMTIEEVRREQREENGNPQRKQRRRDLIRSRSGPNVESSSSVEPV